MSHHYCLRKFLLQSDNVGYRETFVNVTAAIPEQHLTTRHLIDIVTKVIVRTEDQLRILRQLIHHLLSIARSHDDIRQSLYGSRRIHIRYHLIARMLFLELLQVFSLTGVSQRATRIQVRTKHRLLRRQQLTRLCHKVHTAHHHHLCIRLCSLTGQS